MTKADRFNEGKPQLSFLIDILPDSVALDSALYYDDLRDFLGFEYLLSEDMSYIRSLTASIMRSLGSGNILLENYEVASGLSSVFEFGAEKYARDNWKKGLDKEALLDSALRHLIKRLDDSLPDEDEESGIDHFYHCLWNLLVIMYQDREGKQ